MFGANEMPRLLLRTLSAPESKEVWWYTMVVWTVALGPTKRQEERHGRYQQRHAHDFHTVKVCYLLVVVVMFAMSAAAEAIASFTIGCTGWMKRNTLEPCAAPRIQAHSAFMAVS
jgi:hypothetical protein